MGHEYDSANRNPSRQALEDLRDECLNGADCLLDPELHDGPATGIEPCDVRAAREDVAREVCAACPVRDACLEYVLRTIPDDGVWAGLTADEIAVLATLRSILSDDGRMVAP
jgi:WhiB family transcriptional regulator, redox-sensing transcriptional regulator